MAKTIKKTRKSSIDKESAPAKKKEKFSTRVKRFYRNNRIYCILMAVSLACIVLVIAALAIYFLAQTSSSAYGNRLNEIEEYKVDDNLKEVNKYVEGVDGFVSKNIRIQGKTIIVNITVSPEKNLEDLQNIATGTLQYFSTENLSYYDLQFAISREGLKTYYGSKSSTNSTISWAKYNLDGDGKNE